MESQNEQNNSPPHGFHVNDQEPEDEATTQTLMDLSILADAAAKSPVPDVADDLLQAPEAGIPLPSDDNNGNDMKRPAIDEPKAKKAGKTKAKVEITPKKRPTRARKLPTKFKDTPPPSSMTSSSSAMSAAAILVQVSGGTEKKKKKPRKPKASPAAAAGAKDGSASDIRGITMKRPGKWQAQFYYAGQSRYIGIFTSQEKAAQAYEIVRKMLKAGAKAPASTPREAFEISRRAAYEGVGEAFPDGPKKLSPMTTPAKRKRGKAAKK